MPGTLDFEGFISDLKDQILAVWPEVSMAIDAEHASRIPWATLTLPYAVLLIPEWPRSSEGPVNALVFEPTAYVFYVAETGGKAVALREKLVDLTNVLWPDDPLTTGQVWGIGDISVGDDLPPNRIFVDANRSQRAGMVAVKCLVGIDNQED
jgi:hypothetical protein